MPWSGRIPHAAERLGPWAVAAGPACPEPVLRSGRGHNGERPAYHTHTKIIIIILVIGLCVKERSAEMRSEFHMYL